MRFSVDLARRPGQNSLRMGLPSETFLVHPLSSLRPPPDGCQTLITVGGAPCLLLFPLPSSFTGLYPRRLAQEILSWCLLLRGPELKLKLTVITFITLSCLLFSLNIETQGERRVFGSKNSHILLALDHRKKLSNFYQFNILSNVCIYRRTHVYLYTSHTHIYTVAPRTTWVWGC